MDYPKTWLGMTFEELSENMDLSKLSFFAEEKKLRVIAYTFFDYSDVNRIDFIFEVEKWKEKPVEVIPNEARLTYMVAWYNNDVEVKDKLIAEYGVPVLQTIPEIGMINDFDNQWICVSETGKLMQITHTHRRIVYEYPPE